MIVLKMHFHGIGCCLLLQETHNYVEAFTFETMQFRSILASDFLTLFIKGNLLQCLTVLGNITFKGNSLHYKIIAIKN